MFEDDICLFANLDGKEGKYSSSSERLQLSSERLIMTFHFNGIESGIDRRGLENINSYFDRTDVFLEWYLE